MTAKSVNDRYAEILRREAGGADIIKDLGVFTRRMFMSRTLGHWDLYKQVAHLPGDVVELGVYKGETLLNFAKFMEILNPGDRSKRVIGFDHWQGLRNFTEHDGYAPATGNQEGGWSPEGFEQTLFELIELFHQDSFVPGKPRIELVNGDIRTSAAEYVEKNQGLRISLLHFDCDMYEPTLAGLEALYDHVVTGGIVLFDEFAIREWAGESKAVDEFFKGKAPRMEKFGWLSTPGGWFVKQ